MVRKKTGKTQRKAVTSLGAFLLAPMTLPDIKLDALTLPLGKLEYCDGSAWYPVASESWVNTNAPGTITSITAGTGLSGGTITTSGTIALTSTGVLPGSYTLPNISVDATGRILSITNGSVSGTITLGGAVTGSGNIGSTITTSLNSNQNPVSTSLNFNWTNSGSFAEYSCYNWLQESTPPPQFVYAVLAGSFGSNTARGWQFIFQPNALNSLGNFQIDYYNQVSGRQTPFQISSVGSSLRTYVRTTLDMQNNSIINCSLDINTGTTGQLNISRLNGYPTNSSYFLRGDGIWTTPTFSSININTGTTGQLNISRLSGYPTSSNAFLRGDGTWILPYVNNLNINGNVSFSTYNLTTSGTISATTGTLQANNLAAYNSGSLVVQSPLSFTNVGATPIRITNNALNTRIYFNNTNTSASATGLIIQNNGAGAVEFGFNNSTNEAYVWGAGSATLKFGTGATKRMDIASNSGKTTFYDPSNQCYIRPSSKFLDLRGLNVYNSSVSTIFESNALGETSSLVMNGDFMQFINPLDVLGFIFTDEDNSSMTSYVAYINGSGQFVPCSQDKKHSILKKEHKDYLERLNRLNVYSYGLKYEVLKSDSPKKKARKKRKMNELQVGVIAEDVLELFDNATNVYKPLDVSQKTVLSHTPSLAVNYNTLLCYTILAVQELTQRLIALEQKAHQIH